MPLTRTSVFASTLVTLSAITTGVANAQVTELFKLLASDAAAHDEFGICVDVSGNIAIIGSFRNDDNGTDSGSAYLFDVVTGNQIAKLTASDAAGNDWFGWSVAISGNTAIVGARYKNDPLNDSGAAYLFDVVTGKEITKLEASDRSPRTYLGDSVDICGSTAIVGAPGNDDNGSLSGAAYLFDVDTGKEIAKLTPPDPEALDYFGLSVAISGNVAIVGSPRDRLDGAFRGSAYLFDVETGTEIAKLRPSDVQQAGWFGRSVAISENIAIVGSPYNDDNGSYSGSAYLFDVNSGEQIAKLAASDTAFEDDFGLSVATNGNTHIVGSPNNDDNGDNSGSAYIFDAVVPCNAADIAYSCELLDLADIIAFVTGFTNQTDAGDINGDHVFDLTDISEFVTAFLNGCP